MKRQKRNDPRRRPLWTFLCLFGIALLLAASYIAIGSPTLTFEQEFRRAEKANLVGPSQIVDVLDGTYGEFDKMIVGETEYGVCFFGGKTMTVYRNSNRGKEEMVYTFSYREKTGDITVLAAPNHGGAFWGEHGISLPVYVFDCYPAAVRAELELTVTGSDVRTVNDETVITDFTESFAAEAVRTEDGFFRFLLDSRDICSAYALCLLSDLSGNGMYYTNKHIDSVVPGTVRLYDENSKLILEQAFEICSAIAEAHK